MRATPAVTSVSVANDGTWSPVLPDASAANGVVDGVVTSARSPKVEHVIDDPASPIGTSASASGAASGAASPMGNVTSRGQSAPRGHTSSPRGPAQPDVIDLVSSDDEDGVPPAPLAVAAAPASAKRPPPATWDTANPTDPSTWPQANGYDSANEFDDDAYSEDTDLGFESADSDEDEFDHVDRGRKRGRWLDD